MSNCHAYLVDSDSYLNRGDSALLFPARDCELLTQERVTYSRMQESDGRGVVQCVVDSPVRTRCIGICLQQGTGAPHGLLNEHFCVTIHAR